MLGILSAIRFLFMAPLILAFLAVVNLMTSPGVWWVQWAALGLGIAWFIKLFKVARMIVVAGGLAALGYYLWNRYGGTINSQGWTAPQQQPQPIPVRSRLQP